MIQKILVENDIKQEYLPGDKNAVSGAALTDAFAQNRIYEDKNLNILDLLDIKACMLKNCNITHTVDGEEVVLRSRVSGSATISDSIVPSPVDPMNPEEGVITIAVDAIYLYNYYYVYGNKERYLRFEVTNKLDSKQDKFAEVLYSDDYIPHITGIEIKCPNPIITTYEGTTLDLNAVGPGINRPFYVGDVDEEGNSLSTTGTAATTNYIDKKIAKVEKEIFNAKSILPYLRYQNQNNEIIIIGSDYDNLNGSYFIPSTIDGYPVVSIGESAFYAAENLTGIIIPDSVTSIGVCAFCECFNLTNITIGTGVTNIEEAAFQQCESLTDVYYLGTQEQWNKISIIKYNNDNLTNATIHYDDLSASLKRKILSDEEVLPEDYNIDLYTIYMKPETKDDGSVYYNEYIGVPYTEKYTGCNVPITTLYGEYEDGSNEPIEDEAYYGLWENGTTLISCTYPRTELYPNGFVLKVKDPFDCYDCISIYVQTELGGILETLMNLSPEHQRTVKFDSFYCAIYTENSELNDYLMFDVSIPHKKQELISNKQDKFAEVLYENQDNPTEPTGIQFNYPYMSIKAGDDSLSFRGTDWHVTGAFAVGEPFLEEHAATKKYVDDSCVGKIFFDDSSSSNGGTIFNDFTNNKAPAEYGIASGNKTHAGYNATLVNAWDKENKTLTVYGTDGLKVGDIISIDGGNNYPYCATITEINGDKIKVDTEIKDFKGGDLNPSSEAHHLYVDGKPGTGLYRFGSGQTAGGIECHAIAKGATAFGRKNYASGGYSVAIGRDNCAANYAVALGRENKAKGMQSVTLGYQNTVTGKDSAAIGSGNTVSTNNGFAIGIKNTVSGAFAMAINETNTASGSHSFAGGRGTTASKAASFAFGRDVETNGMIEYTAASADGSVAFGLGVKSSGLGAFATGFCTNASGGYSAAFGTQTKAKGTGSFAMGIGSQASGNYSVAMGKGVTTTITEGQAVFGRFNDWQNAGSAIFIIGNGESGAASNAFKVMIDGSAELQKQGTKSNSVVIKSELDKALDRIAALEAKVAELEGTV